MPRYYRKSNRTKSPFSSITGPLDYLHLFLTEDIVDSLVLETNRYMLQRCMGPQRQFSRLSRLREVSMDDMYVFLGITISMGLVEKPAIPDYWTTNYVMNTPGLASLMPRDRFQFILR